MRESESPRNNSASVRRYASGEVEAMKDEKAEEVEGSVAVRFNNCILEFEF